MLAAMPSPLLNVAVGLRQLCSLGLPPEDVVPQFLATLEEAVPSDAHWFNRVDERGVTVASYTNMAEGAHYGKIFHDFLAALAGDSSQRGSGLDELQSAVFTTPGPEEGWVSEDRVLAEMRERQRAMRIFHSILVFYREEILAPNGVRDTVDVTVGTTAKPHGPISLWRAGRARYRPQEREFVVGMSRYLGYALNAPATADPPMVEDDLRGVVLLDEAGRVAQLDECARRMLALAGHGGRDGEAATAEVFKRLALMSRGQPTATPELGINGDWGRFRFRAHWLRKPTDDAAGLAAVTVSQYVPRRLKLWRAAHALALPIRQREVCLWFADGLSLTDIAARQGVSRHTVVDHVRRLYERLEIDPSRDNLRDRLLGITKA